MPESEIVLEDISKIRSPTLLFAMNIMRQTDRIEKLASETVKANDKQSYKAFEAAIRSLHSLIAIRASKQYEKEIEKIEKDLENNGLLKNRKTRFKYYLLLNKWFGLAINEFGKFNILPPQDQGFIAGVGPVKED